MSAGFRFGVVTSVVSSSEAMVLLDGDTKSIHVSYYALPVAVGQRVQVQMAASPSPPLIVDVFAAATSGGGRKVLNFAVGDGETATVGFATSFDIADVITANNAGDLFIPTGWTLGLGAPAVYSITDQGLSVDFDGYPWGSAVRADVYAENADVTTDRYLDVRIGGVGPTPAADLWSVSLPIFPGSFPTGLVGHDGQIVPLSAVYQTDFGVAFPVDGLLVAVSDPTATASGYIALQVYVTPLTADDVYVEPSVS